MVVLNERDAQALRKSLQIAVVRCSERCLYQSAKWAAEMLNALPEPVMISSQNGGDSTMHDDPLLTDQAEEIMTVLSPQTDAREARLEAAELSKYLMAKTYFDCREYDRCAAVFLPMLLPKGEIASTKSKPDNKKSQSTHTVADVGIDGAPHLSQKALFLALYARYMAGEKRRDEESETILGPSDGAMTFNRELEPIQQQLKARFKIQNKRGDNPQGWLEYLYGIVCAKQKNFEEAKSWLLRSVSYYQYNWGAWQELGDLVGTVHELEDLLAVLPQGMMTFIFHIYENQELFQAEDSVLNALKSLKAVFPTSSFLRTQKALLYYHAKYYDKAERTFSKILQRDPLRLDYLEAYSNILFVMDKTARLAFIAQVATSTDRFRPETCLAVGNYFAKRSEHEKAIVYFRRALTLDRSYQAAWTLMGHEYLELRNTHAAVECYRRAIDINRKDFRAWYGLGQAYELLEMHLYSLYYFQRATALSPPDPKMWVATGQCLDKLGRWQQAIKAYKRALAAGAENIGDTNTLQHTVDLTNNLDPDITHAIALDYDKLNDTDAVRGWLELTIAQEEGILERAEEAGELNASTTLNDSFAKQSIRSAIEEDLGGVMRAGTGVTATTSKAKLWLARLEYVKGEGPNLVRALQLTNDLLTDGYEVEEAKALMHEIQGRMSAKSSVPMTVIAGMT